MKKGLMRLVAGPRFFKKGCRSIIAQAIMMVVVQRRHTRRRAGTKNRKIGFVHPVCGCCQNVPLGDLKKKDSIMQLVNLIVETPNRLSNSFTFYVGFYV
jgi:hypothetical protein